MANFQQRCGLLFEKKIKIMKKIFGLLFLVVAFIGAIAQTNVNKSFMFDGVLRDYIIHLPTGYSSAQTYPLVFNLHGYTSTAAEEQLYTKMDEVANTDPEKFIVVYPNGIANYWNSFTATGNDDVGFISAVIDSMHAQYPIDLNRVYSCGMSNGGFQSYRLACELSNRIVAIASVTGSMSNYVYANCHPGRPMPVLEIHGTADATVPYTGLVGCANTETVIQFWKDNNGCGTSDTTPVADINTTDNSTVDKIKFNGCLNNDKVWFYKVWNGGHTWPSALINLPGVNTNRDIDASQEIWDFFKQYTMSNVNSIAADNNTSSRIKVYPNPTANFIDITATTPIIAYQITDRLGQLIQSKTIDPTVDMRIDVQTFANGLYFIATTDREQTISISKIVVQH